MGRIHPETTSWLRDKAHSPIASTILKSVQPLFHQPRVKFHCSQGYTFSLSSFSLNALSFPPFAALLRIPFGFIGIRDHCPADRLCFLARALSSMRWKLVDIGPTLFHKVQQQRRDERIIGTRFEKYLEKYLSTRKGNLKGLLTVASSLDVGENRMEYRRVFDETVC